ncbi:RidA family protein [Neolewinella antarctica]|uniref:Reactive intermediate/imine deaminase n=1 Tax=Neolewinella antarctica TaxID=442734 RepID=A0ABX0X7J0_9BACT|nr:RidA family protein [Neolewinella antarctica]NJC25216.1 reactive intermediate/imine deaminase [Neolewinella antarctica]
MKIVTNKDIPTPEGHYSPIVEHNGTLYVSGQIPRTEAGQVPDGIEAQTELVFSKLAHLLTAAGSSTDRVIQVRIYLTDIALWDTVNQLYSDFFGDHRPARCVVPTGELHYGCLIELEAIAAV